MAELILPDRDKQHTGYQLNADARLKILEEAGCGKPPIVSGKSKITSAEIEVQRVAFIAMYGDEFGQTG